MTTKKPSSQWRATKSHCKEIYGLDEHDAVIDSNGLMVCDVCPNLPGLDTAARAQLVAAAPKLLEACEQACQWFADQQDESEDGMVDLLCAAIASARREAA